MLDQKLKEYATPTQCRYIDAINEHGSARKAAAALGCHPSAVDKSLLSAKKAAALHGYSPEHDMHKTVPDPFVVRGTSTLYDENGNTKLQWVKTRLDDAKLQEAIQAAVEALSEEVVRMAPSEAPALVHGALANLYTLTDTHIGAKAWDRECGDDWDLEIAEATLTKAFRYLVDATPFAKVGIVNFLGDIQHYDSLESVTPMHRNLLDSDSRFPKMVQITVRILRAVVMMALERHEQVIVSFQEGNHDPASSVWLKHLFSLLFENEPRCEVLDHVTPYSVIQHGETMLAFHHGHLTKNDSLPMLFAAQYPKVWGDTTRRYAHTGHRHHVEEKEHNGMIVIQHPTIAARDAYAARGGWIADRSMTAITYHDKFGQVARVTAVPEMLA